MSDSTYPVTMPKWGIEMQEGTIVDWHISQGSEIARGDELIDIETDKIVNTMEAPTSGVLHRCLAAKGETLKVGSLLGVIASADSDENVIDEFIAGFKPADTAVSNEDESKVAEPAQAAPPPQKQSQPPNEPSGAPPKRVRVSPAAARKARELGVDISKVTSTGRRISPADVERYAQQQTTSDSVEQEQRSYEAFPLSATRKSIARRLVEAKQQIPHFYLSIDVNMDNALEQRKQINSQSTQKVSINDVVIHAVVRTLQAVPNLNIHLVQDEIRRFSQVNIAVAVATERGIITPVIHQAETLGINELAKAAAALGERARNASLAREDVADGTFTVSNLGMYGISEFQAIINPPQGAILALGSCEERIIPAADSFQKTNVMRMTLSCDHRAIDGALGAQFLAELKANLEGSGDT